MDDDDLNETNTIATTDETAAKPAAATTASADSASAKPAAPAAAAAAATAAVPASAAAEAEEPAPPPKPPRPLTEQQKAEQTLKDAFPTVEAPVIKAVLTASRGNVESAFHALLEMTDPSAVEQEAPPPPQPPRPPMQDPQSQAAYGRLSPNSQLAADEEYARRLAMQYENEGAAYEHRTSTPYARSGNRRNMDPAYPSRPRPETGLKPNEMWGEREHSFIDDDLPVIQENLRKGFVETQNKFNTWFTGIKKRIDDEFNHESDDEDDGQHPGSASTGRPGQPGRPGGPGRGGYGTYGSRQQGRRSGDYDADPTLLTDDFAGIQLHGDGTPVRMPNNPNVFRPPPLSTSPRPEGERKVSFRDGDEVIDMYSASPKVPSKDGLGTAATKTSKWQPMSSVDPTPIADNDPFSLGDSEDEKDTAKAPAPAAPATPAKTDAPAADAAAKPSDEEAERLRKAAAEAMADSLVDDKPKA